MLRSLLLLGLLLIGGVARAAVVDRVAAVVDDEVIALSEVYDLGRQFIEDRCRQPGAPAGCRREAELEVLDSIILRVLMRQELERLDMAVTAEDVDRSIDAISRDNGYETRAELREAVEASGLRWDTYREQLTEQLLQMKFTESIIRPRIVVREDELVDLYQRLTRDEVSGPSLAVLDATMVSAPVGEPEALADLVMSAREAVAAIRAGEATWESLTETFPGASQQPMGAGGVRVEDLAPALAEVVVDQPAGSVTDPVLLGGSLLVLRVVEWRSSDVAPYESLVDQLREQVYKGKIDAEVEQWYLQARRQASVQVLLESE